MSEGKGEIRGKEPSEGESGVKRGMGWVKEERELEGNGAGEGGKRVSEGERGERRKKGVNEGKMKD